MSLDGDRDDEGPRNGLRLHNSNRSLNNQEFRVESSAYPAEFGTRSGGQVSVITKSGSNGWHGSAFEYPHGRLQH